MAQGVVGTHPSTLEGLRASVVLNNGVHMPWLGLGVWQSGDDAATRAIVHEALALGYRSVDTARIYGNERGVGQAVRDSGLPRSEIFVTTKIWNDDVRAGRVEKAFDESMRRLGLDYVDLCLVHWPIRGKVASTWGMMEKLVKGGRVRAIGVSNHLRVHLEDLLNGATVVPAVNQIELHPYLQSRPLQNFCREKGMQVEAWSPLMQGGAVLEDPAVVRLAHAHRKTPAQIILRWNVQAGIVTIPKSVRRERMAENAAVFDFELSSADMAAMAALDRDERVGPDPRTINF